MLIAIEGIDGAGKTTIARFLRDELEKRGFSVILLKEPTDGEYGRRIKEAEDRFDPEEELQLFLLDRKEDVEKNILPALREGKVVIMDRYYISSIAYQGARGLDLDEIRKMNEEIAPKPDLIIILDVSPQEGLKRVGKRGSRTVFEEESYLAEVRENFLRIGEKMGENGNVKVINAERELEEVKKDVLDAVLRVLSRESDWVSG